MYSNYSRCWIQNEDRMNKEDRLLFLRVLGSLLLLSTFFLSGFVQILLGISSLGTLLLSSFVSVEQGKQEVYKEIQDSFPDVLLPKNWVLSQLGESVSRLWVDVAQVKRVSTYASPLHLPICFCSISIFPICRGSKCVLSFAKTKSMQTFVL